MDKKNKYYLNDNIEYDEYIIDLNNLKDAEPENYYTSGSIELDEKENTKYLKKRRIFSFGEMIKLYKLLNVGKDRKL